VAQVLSSRWDALPAPFMTRTNLLRHPSPRLRLAQPGEILRRRPPPSTASISSVPSLAQTSAMLASRQMSQPDSQRTAAVSPRTLRRSGYDCRPAFAVAATGVAIVNHTLQGLSPISPFSIGICVAMKYLLLLLSGRHLACKFRNASVASSGSTHSCQSWEAADREFTGNA